MDMGAAGRERRFIQWYIYKRVKVKGIRPSRIKKVRRWSGRVGWEW